MQDVAFDKRSLIRGDVLHAGICVLADGKNKFSCSIRDRSADGLRLSFPIPRDLPRRFWLIDVPARLACYVKLAWVANTDAGLAILHKEDIARIQDPSLSYLRRIWEDRTEPAFRRGLK